MANHMYDKNGERLPATKVCTECGEAKPRTAIYFHEYSGRSVDGLRPACKECHRLKDKLKKRAARAEEKEKAL